MKKNRVKSFLIILAMTTFLMSTHYTFSEINIVKSQPTMQLNSHGIGS